MNKKFDINVLKERMGLKGTNINVPEDYSSIHPDAWYYVLGDGGMKGKDVIAKHIAMHRVSTWAKHKEDLQVIENEKKRKLERYDEIPF